MQTIELARVGLVIAALAVPLGGSAGGQSVDVRDDVERPWARGVPAEQVRAAREIFLAGNKLFNEALFGKAVGKFMGCPAATITGELAGALGKAPWQWRVAVGSYIAAGAGVTTGLVLVYLNRARLVKVEPRSDGGGAVLIPHVSPESVGLSARFHF